MENYNHILEKVQIIDAGSNGKAIAKVNNVVIFVPFAAPGDVVDIKIVLTKKNYLEGRIVNVHKFSENRVTPFCKHFGTCGGCNWQHLMYNDQLKYKRKQIIDNFIRIGKFMFPEVNPIIPSKEAIFYRNKIEYSFSNRRWFEKDDIDENETFLNSDNKNLALGYYIPQRFDRILDVKQCYLQKAPSDSLRLAIKKYAIENKYEFYDIKKRTGFLRNVIIRNSSTGEFLVIMVFNYEDKKKINDILEHISTLFPDITSLFYVINSGHNEVLTTLKLNLFKGKPFMVEKMEDLVFRVGPVSFYQTNSQQAYQLYRVTRDYAEIEGKKQIVYDLYTGTGTIALFVANKAKKVIGIEYNDQAVQDARINAEINNIDNAEFFSGDIAKLLDDDFVNLNGKPDVIITDPPRAGMHPRVIQQIIKISAPIVVYVSCNPATQARDIASMSDYYDVKNVQPVDMFPQTFHVENVVQLVRKDSLSSQENPSV